MNPTNSAENAAALWKCDECGLQDTNLHLLSYSGYESLSDGEDLQCILDGENAQCPLWFFDPILEPTIYTIGKNT